MNTYVTSAVIRQLREQQKLTQAELADRIGVSSKAVSKWETAKGLPDIALLQPLSKVLNVSVTELVNGQQITNQNRSANLLRSRFYVCPVCGNVIHCIGDSVISCCGISLPPLEAEDPDPDHSVNIQPVEDEHYLSFPHCMTKEHSLSFAAFVTSDRVQLVKFYPEGNAETRMQLRGFGILYWYCNRHGLYRRRV